MALLTQAAERGAPRALLAAAGRALALGGYSALYVLTAEALPTSLRATGFGLASCCSRLAGTATPHVAGAVYRAYPTAALLAYAAAGLACAVALALVTDTTDQPLAELGHAVAPSSPVPACSAALPQADSTPAERGPS